MSENFLYHKVPEDLQGNILYPLNQLKNIYPDIYESKAKKYEGRESLMGLKIPMLDCLWNDVLHFTAVNPKDIRKALNEAGSPNKNEWDSFKINPRLLDPQNTIVYLYKFKNVGEGMVPENLEAYNPDDISKYSTIPDLTKEYYKMMVSENKRPLAYPYIAHILYKGMIDISNCEIIKSI